MLYALSVTNLTILVALAFVLARNVVKLIVERRKALPFARFRFKLVTVLLGMTLIPAVLVLIIGSELIRNNVDRWFNADLDEVLSSANGIAGDYYAQQQRLVSAQAQRFARALSAVDLAAARPSSVRDLVAPDVLQERVDLVEVYRVSAPSEARPPVVPVLDVAAPSIPRQYSRALADRLAERAAASGKEERAVEQLSGGGDLIRTADAHPVLVFGSRARRGGDERVPDRPVCRASAQHDGGLRGLSTAARAEAASRRRPISRSF